MYLNQKDFKKIAQALELAGRINELERLEPWVPSSHIIKRRSTLIKELKELVDVNDKEEKIIEIKVELPEQKEKKKDPFTFNLCDLFKKRVKDDDDDDESVIRVIRGLIPEENRITIGKIIEKL